MYGAKYNLDWHHRRSIRLKSHDYGSPGFYFLTMCTQDRECLFGAIEDGAMRLNRYGQIASSEWHKSAEIRREIELDAFVIMPNHLHGLVVIRDNHVRAHGCAPLGRAPLRGHTSAQRPSRSLGSFVASFKSAVTKRINEVRGTRGAPVWQRNFYERIVRNEDELDRIRQYIVDNPRQWASDIENTQVLAHRHAGATHVSP